MSHESEEFVRSDKALVGKIQKLKRNEHMASVKFGWRVPDFPIDSSASSIFRDQIHHNLAQIQDKFDSAWVSDPD